MPPLYPPPTQKSRAPMGVSKPPPILIDPDFKALIPPLTEAERQQLEENLKTDGCRDPLVLWGRVLLDGHNRHEICARLGIYHMTVSVDLPDRDAALRWVIHNQFGRRNLTPFARAELALRLKPVIEAKAKENLVTSTGGVNPRPLSMLTKAGVNTRQEVAVASGVSEGTLHKAAVIAAKAPEEIKEKLRAGETTINAEYHRINQKEQRREKESARSSRVEAARSLPPTVTLYRDDALKKLPELARSGFRVPLIATDPPYNQGIADWDVIADYPDFCRRWVGPAADCLTPGGSLYVCGTFRSLHPVYSAAEAAGLVFQGDIVWDFLTGPGGVVNGEGGSWPPRHNLILWFSKPGAAPVFNREAVQVERHEAHIREYRGVTYDLKTPGSVWRFPVVDDASPERAGHPTQKPVALMRRIVLAGSNPGDAVMDTFAGTGTTLVAALAEGRHPVGIEKDSGYCEIVHARTALPAEGGRP